MLPDSVVPSIILSGSGLTSRIAMPALRTQLARPLTNCLSGSYLRPCDKTESMINGR